MPNGNIEEFRMATEILRGLGHTVINPHELTEGHDLHPERDYETIMRIDVCAMCESATEVVTLHGWENSPGANREVKIARLMNIPVSPILKYIPSTPQH